MWEPAESAVQEVRQALGLSQRELADEAGVSHSYLSRYERGQVVPKRRWLRRVTGTLGRLVAVRHQEDSLHDH